MAEESFEDKTEQPTPKKRDEARKKGQVAKSRELPSVAVILSGITTLTFFCSYMYKYIQKIMKEAFSLSALNDVSVNGFIIFAERMLSLFILAMVPIFAAIVITAILTNVMQVGFLLSYESLKPTLSKINPIKGFERLFSKQSFVELFKSLLKLAIIGGLGYLAIKNEIKDLPLLGDMEIASIIVYILKTAFVIVIKCILAMLFLVAIDYAFQKWDFEKKLKMTKKEVKDEHKRSEGDPLVKSRIRSIQIQMARKRMMQAVPKADVVITNPTHLAIALKYDNSSMEAPKLLAKGAGKVAEKIKKLAEEYNIPIVENRELAHSLYSLVEVDQEIPASLYKAVAEVLAYIYKLKGAKQYEVA
jgi:flagellar biosynthesis protein FlhB